MNLIQHFVNGKIIPGKSDRRGKVFNPAIGEQESEVILGSKSDLDNAVEVAKKAGCDNSQLMHSEKEIPYNEISNSNTIGISSGASAPEVLVNNFINDLKKRFTVNIDEVEAIKENVVFKIPKKLN